MEDRTCSIEGCDKAVSARTWCRVHYKRWAKWGDPTFKAKAGKGQALAFLKRAAAASTDDCIFYPHYRSRPKFRLDGQYVNASRAVWILAYGDPGSLYVLHTCHQGARGCVNVLHLYLGDQARNIRDAVDSGRQRSLGGQESPKAKLTNAEAANIRERHLVDGVTQSALAIEYGVSRTTIQGVLLYRTYKPGATS